MRKLCLVLLVLLFLLSGCRKAEKKETAEGTEAVSAEKENKASTLEGMFVLGQDFQAFYEDGSSPDEVRTQIVLNEEEKEEFLSLVKPYANEVSDDILKSEFMRQYIVQLNPVLTLIIDAEWDYPDHPGKTYMHVHKRVGSTVTLYGVYIDTSVAEYLEAKKG